LNLGHLDFDIVSDFDIRISDFKLPDNSLPNMMIQSKTNNHLSIINNHLAFCPLHLSRTLYKSALFMQNKPNFQDVQMNVSSILTKDYERNDIFAVPENKANTNPIKANQTQYKANQTQFPCPQTSPGLFFPLRKRNKSGDFYLA